MIKSLQPSDQLVRWPLPDFDENNQPHFLFIIAPPNSGSTAIAGLLNSSCRTMFLDKNGEGQWLIPGLCEEDRWSPGKEIYYDSIKAVWLDRFQKVQQLTQTIDTVIEKSPPNMMRMERLISNFSDCSCLAINRNPYANCASKIYRYHDAKNRDSNSRRILLTRATQNWLVHSSKIRELVVKLNVPLITYEAFCDDPASVLNKLTLPDGVESTIDFNSKVKVKDYKIQTISNQNELQISKLSVEEIGHISSILTENCELIEFFGYESIGY